MNDTLSVVKSLANDPVPYVNTGVFLGMSVMDWDLAFKVILGFVSITWTVLKIVNEYRILRNGKLEK
jgi:hypothetical protein